MNDPAHEEHESYLEWWGDVFDPEAFDVSEVDEMLENIDRMEWWDFE